jgi:hypothetical protein
LRRTICLPSHARQSVLLLLQLFDGRISLADIGRRFGRQAAQQTGEALTQLQVGAAINTSLPNLSGRILVVSFPAGFASGAAPELCLAPSPDFPVADAAPLKSSNDKTQNAASGTRATTKILLIL